MAQVDQNRHALQTGDSALHLQRVFAKAHIQGHRRAVTPFDQGVGLHHAVGQHGDFVAGHVNGGQACAAKQVHRTARAQRQSGRSNVDAHGDRARSQSLKRQGVVDFGGVRIVNRKRLHRGQRQVLCDGRRLQGGKARALGEQVKQKPLPMKIPGRSDGPSVLQQVQRCCLAAFAGLDHSLVLGGVFVGSKQDFVELLANRLGASARHQIGRPGFDLGLNLLFLFDGLQGLLHDFGRGFAKAPFDTAPAKVMRCFVQAQQGSHLLGGGGVVAEIVFGQVDKAELLVRGAFVSQFQLDGLAQHPSLGKQNCRGRFVEPEQHVGRFDLDPFTGVEFDLRGSLGFGHDPSGHEFAGIFK